MTAADVMAFPPLFDIAATNRKDMAMFRGFAGLQA
jgi:hypothetical protein